MREAFSPSLLLCRDELRANLTLLQGVEMSEDTAIRLIEAIDIDHSGDVDELEFVAWMELNTSQLKTTMIVAKILLGLGQIMSKQPETLKEKFPVRPLKLALCFWCAD